MVLEDRSVDPFRTPAGRLVEFLHADFEFVENRAQRFLDLPASRELEEEVCHALAFGGDFGSGLPTARPGTGRDAGSGISSDG